MKNFLKLTTAFLLVIGCLWITPDTYQASESLLVNNPSIEDIKQFVKDHPAKVTDATAWQTQPSIVSPYLAGEISSTTRISAFNMLNQIRYIAGIPADVTNDANYEKEAQAAALVNAANGSLSHEPNQPAGMDLTLYNLGKQGAGNSNLGSGSSTSGGVTTPRSLNKTIVDGWMKDDSGTNLTTLGHRRWVINPNMKKSAFGAAGNYTAMYSFDNKTNSNNNSYKRVAWPARKMPIEYWGSTYPWSVSMATNVDINSVQVTLTRHDGQTWSFSKGSSDDGYFNVDNDGYGQTGCIIFRPDINGITYNKGDEFNVTITGIDTPISYDVKFFEIDGPESIALSKSAITLESGAIENVSLTVVPATTNAINGITCESSSPNVASVTRTGSNIKITANEPGTTTITVTSADGTVSNSCVITVSPRPQTLGGTDNYNKIYGDTDFTLDTTHEIGNGVLSYVSSDTSVATVDGNGLVSILKSGSTTITVKAAANEYYTETTKQVAITVAKASQTISGPASYSKKHNDGAFTLDAILTVGDGTLSYSSSNTGVATVNSNGNITILKGGETVITIEASETTNYNSETKRVNLMVAKQPQEFLGDTTYNQTYGDAPFHLNTFPTEGPAELSYASDNDNVASVNTLGLVTINGAGIATITVTVAETETHAETSTTITIIVARGEQTLDGVMSYDKTIGIDDLFNLYITHTGDGNLNYESSDENVVRIDNNGNATLVSSGLATITINAEETINCNSTSIDVYITVNKGTQTLSGTSTHNKLYGDVPFNLNITRPIGNGTVLYESRNNETATVDASGNITIVRPGTAVINVKAAETASYNESAAMYITITVAKGIPTWSGDTSYSKMIGDATFPLNIRSTSDGELRFESDNLNVATVDAVGRVTVEGEGTTIIRVTALPTVHYEEPVEKEIVIIVSKKVVSPTPTTRPTPTTQPTPTTPPTPTKTPVTSVPAKRNQTIAGSASYTKTHGNKAFTLDAKRTVGNGNLTYTSSNNKVVTVDGKGKVTIKGSGNATITINAAATSNFNAASKKVTITVKPKKATLSSVKSNAKKKITIKWKKVATITGYEIQYSTDKKFKKATTTKTITKASTTSKTYSVLNRNKNYYVRIRAYKSSGGQKIYGAWTTSKAVKIK